MKNTKYSIKSIETKAEVEDMLWAQIKELGELDNNNPFAKKPEGIFKYMDSYWAEENKNPLFMLIDGKVAGFAVITVVSGDRFELEDYYIKPQFRANSNSLNMVNYLYDAFIGEWQFLTGKDESNIRAIKFWDKFCKQFNSVNR